jgi:hypothetical protein
MQKGIHAGAAVDGGRLPENEPETIKRKGDNRPLIETGTLLGSFIANARGKSKVMITIGSERRAIGTYLQKEGVKTKHGLKFYKFFGISKDAERLAVAYARDKINKVIGNAR